MNNLEHDGVQAFLLAELLWRAFSTVFSRKGAPAVARHTAEPYGFAGTERQLVDAERNEGSRRR